MAEFKLWRHSSTGVLTWGGGTAYDTSGGAVRKLFNIGVEFENRSNSNDIFLPDSSAEERRAVHNYLGNVPGVLTYRGNFIDNEGFLRRDNIGQGVYCWGGSNIPGSGSGGEDFQYLSACPAGWSDGGYTNYTSGPMTNNIGGGNYNSYITGVDSDPTANSDITGDNYYLGAYAADSTASFNYSGSVSGSLATFKYQGAPSLGDTADDGSVRIPLSSTFTFFGRSYDYCYFNTNGSITFHRPFVGWNSYTNTINSPRQPAIFYRSSNAASRNNDLIGFTNVTYSSVTGGTRLLYTWGRYSDNSKRCTVEIYLVGNKIEAKYRDNTDSEFRFALSPGLIGNLPAGLSSTGNGNYAISGKAFPYSVDLGTGNSDVNCTTHISEVANITTASRIYWAAAYALGYYNICPAGYQYYRIYVRMCRRGGSGLSLGQGNGGDDQWTAYTVP
jgi:hypothetical protein